MRYSYLSVYTLTDCMLNEALKANDKTLLSFVYDSLSATEVIHVAMNVKERANFPFLLKTGTDTLGKVQYVCEQFQQG